jgi:predicted ferric reductase
MKVSGRRAIWIAAYMLGLLAPVAIMVLAPRPASRQFWRDAAVALGYVGFALMGLQFIPTGRLPFLTDLFALDAIYRVHHQLSKVAFFLVLAHPMLLIVQNPYNFVALNLLGAPWRLRAGVIAFIVLIGLIATSIWRLWLRLSYEAWRILHNIFSLAVIGFAFYHIVWVNYYTSQPIQRALWVAYIVVWAGMILYIRLIKPIRLLKYPYEITDIIEERGKTWTMVLEPIGHAGHDFRAGQVAWPSVGHAPFFISEHPFSYASAEGHPTRVEFAIRELGDWTSQVGTFQKGTKVYIDGPYGIFDMEDHPGEGYVFIAGGIGSAPVMSMLRTLAERGDQQSLTFFYGNPTWESITFREELDELKGKLNLTLVHVLERPPEGWEGETGYIAPDVLARHLPKDCAKCVYFICGPLPMIRIVTKGLKQLGVPMNHVHSEQYDMA